MDANAAASNLFKDPGRNTRENDSLNWFKDRIQGLRHPRADCCLPLDPACCIASKEVVASGSMSRPASGGSLEGSFPPMAQVNGLAGGVQSAFMPFQAPAAPQAAMQLDPSMDDGEAATVPPPKRFRLFGSWVESAVAESGQSMGSLSGVQKGGFQEQQDGGWEQQLLDLVGAPDRRGTSRQREGRQGQPRLQKVGVGGGVPLETFERNTAFWKEEEAEHQVQANPRNPWRTPMEDERHFLQGKEAGEQLERSSSREKRDLASLKLHFGPDSLLLYGGKTDPVAGGFGFFREDAAFLKRKRLPEQLVQHPPKAERVDNALSGMVGGGARMDGGENAGGGADGGWFNLAKETTGGMINVFEEDLRTQRAGPNREGLEGSGPAAPGAGGLRIIPFQLIQLTTAGGFTGLEGVINSRGRQSPRAEMHEQQDARSSAPLGMPPASLRHFRGTCNVSVGGKCFRDAHLSV